MNCTIATMEEMATHSTISKFMEDYELDAEELKQPKPYTPERAAEISELMSEIADLFNEIQG